MGGALRSIWMSWTGFRGRRGDVLVALCTYFSFSGLAFVELDCWRIWERSFGNGREVVSRARV